MADETTLSPEDALAALGQAEPRLKEQRFIAAIEIENFKGIGAPVRIDLRPITLLFGRNSAGKSTILQALCYAHEILSHRNVDARKVELGGEQIDLGGYRQFVHGRVVERDVRLRFELDLQNWRQEPPKGFSYKGYESPDGPDWLDGIPRDARSGWVELVVTWSRDRGKPALATYEVGIDESLVGRVRSDAEGNRLEFNRAHPIFDQSRTAGSVPENGGAGDARRSPNPKTASRELQGVKVEGRTLPLPDWDESIRYDFYPALQEDAAMIDGSLLDALVCIGYFLREELADLRYLGPVRRLQAPATTEPRWGIRGTWSDGSEAWNLLQQRDPDPWQADPLLSDVNDWLDTERLDTKYKLCRRSTIELSTDDVPLIRLIKLYKRILADRLNDDGAIDPDLWVKNKATEVAKIVDGDPVEFAARIRTGRDDASRPDEDDLGVKLAELVNTLHERYKDCLQRHKTRLDMGKELDELEHGRGYLERREYRQHLVHAIVEAPERVDLQLVSTAGDVAVRTSDVGVGISQILPVVVAALDPERPGITAIEQPEIHVHPRMQVELGDLFAQDVEPGRIFLIETHSEHLILRVLRRIEETHGGDLPEGKPALRPDDVSVVFLDQVDGATRATQLRIDETGEFIDRWPQGFFEERDEELF